MKKYLITFSFLFIALIASGQYGYLGKSVYIDYNSYSSLSPFNPTFKTGEYESEINLTGMNFTHEIGLHKILNRKKEINFSYGFARSAFYEYDDGFNDFNGYHDATYSSNKMHIHTYSFAFRSYHNGMFKNRWAVAPFGAYVDLKPYLSSLTLSYKENDDADLVKVSRINTMGLALGFGRQKVIFDKLTFNYGVQFSLPFKVISIIRDGASYSNTFTPLELYNNSAYKRLFSKTGFEIKVGLGLLAF